jgi:O-antigen ligase
MTGRLELWKAVVEAIGQKPILGFGFSGFWMGASAGSDTVQRQILWSPLYSHNGYLEIALSLGLVGLFLAILFLTQGFRRAWVRGHTGDSPHRFWPLALLLFVAIHNLGECSIAWQNSLEWSVCVATIVGCDPKLREAFESHEGVEDISNEPIPECA